MICNAGIICFKCIIELQGIVVIGYPIDSNPIFLPISLFSAAEKNGSLDAHLVLFWQTPFLLVCPNRYDSFLSQGFSNKTVFFF